MLGRQTCRTDLLAGPPECSKRDAMWITASRADGIVDIGEPVPRRNLASLPHIDLPSLRLPFEAMSHNPSCFQPQRSCETTQVGHWRNRVGPSRGGWVHSIFIMRNEAKSETVTTRFICRSFTHAICRSCLRVQITKPSRATSTIATGTAVASLTSTNSSLPTGDDH